MGEHISGWKPISEHHGAMMNMYASCLQFGDHLDELVAGAQQDACDILTTPLEVDFLKEFAERGYAILPCIIDTETFFSCFQDFLSLSEVYKKEFHHHFSADEEKSFIGWKRKDDIDIKEYIHYNYMFEHAFKEHIKGNEHLQDFVLCMRNIYATCQQIMGMMFVEMVKRYPEYFSDIFPMRRRSLKSLLRGVQYDVLEEKKLLTQPHTDRWDMTFVLGATQPGLYVGKNKKYYTSLDIAPGHIVVFPGEGIARRTNNTIPATLHKVQQLELEEKRMSLVFFGQI